MNKVSVIIITKNEESRIGQALQSAQWADEIIIVDSYSLDKTAEIAGKYTDKIYFREFDDFSSQKNFAITKCSNNWVFSLDSDEIVSVKLKNSILSAITTHNNYVAFRVKRLNRIFGKILLHAAGDDFPVRLFKRGKAEFVQPIHEFLKADGYVGLLQGDLLHNSIPDMKSHIDKTNKYTELEAKWLLKKNTILSIILKMIFLPLFIFIKLLVFKKGFLDGKEGLLFAMASARYAFIKHLKALRRSSCFANKQILLKNNWEDFYKGVDIENELKYQMNVHSEFIDAITNSTAKKILEVGTGAGSTALAIMKYKVADNVLFITIDRDVKLLKRACDNAKAVGFNLMPICADAFNLPFKDKSFDVVFSQGLLEHFDDCQIKRLIDEKLRVSSGFVLFSVPNNYYRVKDFGDERLLSCRQWDRLMSGYNIMESKNYYNVRLKKNLLRRLSIMYMCKVKAN